MSELELISKPIENTPRSFTCDCLGRKIIGCVSAVKPAGLCDYLVTFRTEDNPSTCYQFKLVVVSSPPLYVVQELKRHLVITSVVTRWVVPTQSKVNVEAAFQFGIECALIEDSLEARRLKTG